MEHTPLLAALRDMLNMTGVAALITGVFLITRGRADARILLKQIEQKRDADVRDDDRDDAKERRESVAQATKIIGDAAAAAAADAKDCRERCAVLQAELDRMDLHWAKKKTNAQEILELTDIPGAIETLKAHRERFREAAS